MPELIPAKRVKRILQHFRGHSHVGIKDVYCPERAPAAIRELEAIAEPYEFSTWGERKATIIACESSSQRPHATEVLDCIGTCARLLGVALWPVARGGTAIIDLIRMAPRACGHGHRDTHSLIELVAITTLQGSSELVFEGGISYVLRPGDVVYHDPEKQLWHQGVAGPDGERIGMVVAKEA